MNGDLSIVVDTNVFVQLFNPAVNSDSHIDRLLQHLVRARARLCIDDHSKEL